MERLSRVEGGKDAIEIYEKIKKQKRRQRRDVGGGRGGGNKTLLTRGGSGQLIPEDVSLFSTIDTTNPEYTKGTLKDIIEGSLPNCVTVEVTPDLET